MPDWIDDLTDNLSQLSRNIGNAVGSSWRWLRSWGTLFASALAAVGAIAQQVDWPASFWSNNRDWANPALVGLAGFALTIGPANAIYQERRRRQATRNLWIRSMCHQIVYGVIESYPFVSWRALSAHVWMVSGSRISRVEGYRMEPREDTTTGWRKGVGAIGQSWLGDETIEADLSNLHTAAVIDEQAYMRIPAQERFNLTWNDFLRTRRYWYVIVIPLRDDRNKFVGCVSIDSVEAGDFERFVEVCSSPAVRGPVGTIQLFAREG